MAYTILLIYPIALLIITFLGCSFITTQKKTSSISSNDVSKPALTDTPSLDDTTLASTGTPSLDDTTLASTSTPSLDDTTPASTGTPSLDDTTLASTGAPSLDDTTLASTGTPSLDDTTLALTGTTSLDDTTPAQDTLKAYSSDNIWSHEQTKSLEAFACLGIILHHLTQITTTYSIASFERPITLLNSMGVLFTAIFFFFSGYGLILSQNTKPDYVKNFFFRRLPVIIIPFYTINLIYLIFSLYYKKTHNNVVDIIQYVTGYRLLNGNSWYIIEIFFLYLAFFILFSLIKKRDIAISIYIVLTMIIIAIGFNSGHDAPGNEYHWFKGEWWYNSTSAFIMGIIFARFKEKIVAFILKHYYICLAIVTILFIASTIFEEKMLNRYGYYDPTAKFGFMKGQTITFISQIFFCCLFILLMLILNMKLNIGNRVLKFVGTFSLELYLIHGLFVQLFSSTKYNRLKPYMFYLLVIICSVAVAFIMSLIDKFILAKIKLLTEGQTYHTDCDWDLIRKKRQERLKKIKNVIIVSVVVIVIILIGIGIYEKLIRPYLEYKDELTSLNDANVGDQVYFGRYETDYKHPGTERLEWLVLKKNDTSIMLITTKGIGPGTYFKSRGIVNWVNSDLYAYLNDDLYNTFFTKYEKRLVSANPDDGALLSLLSPAEALTLFPDKLSRELALTDAALDDGKTNLNELSKVDYWDMKGYRGSWWWLRGDDTYSGTAPYVTVNGDVKLYDKEVYSQVGAVRPVVWITLP